MDVTPFLIFRLSESFFGVEATSVLEIVPLPEITKLEEAPIYVVGIVHFHGRVVPIVDMHLRFGYSVQAHGLDDCIIFLERHGKVIGILVNDATVVHDFKQGDFAPMSSYGFEVAEGKSRPGHQFISGVASWEGKVIMRLDIDNMLDLSQSFVDLYECGSGASNESQILPEGFTLADREILRERALKLAEHDLSDQSESLAPLAVVRIGVEFFGIALEAIREFAELRNVSPIPCCPEHVIGQVNIRGDLITVTDVGRALGQGISQHSSDRKIVIMNDSTLTTGVIVDELLGVVYPKNSEINTTIGTSGFPEHGYRIGTMTDGPRTLSLIDLPNLLRQGSLIVNGRPS